MIETITLGPGDAEIEYTKAGPIIHIFPTDAEPKKVIQDLVVFIIPNFFIVSC